MATADRPPPQHLTFLAAAGENVRKKGMFPVVRGAEARAHGLPRIGRAKRPSQDVVQIVHLPSLGFQDRTLEDIRIDKGRAKVMGYWLGLTGPMGPLPTHLTEFSVYERRYAKSHPFSDFLDLISARMLQFFYRAWAESQPAAQCDRPDDDRFAAYLTALTGAGEGVGEASRFPLRARLHYAGLFVGRRSATAIEDALSHLLAVPARVIEFQPRWRDIEPEDQSRPGQAFARLGSDLVVGKRARVASDAFRVVIRTTSFKQFESLLPSGPLFAIAAEALDAFAPKHLEWDLMLEINERIVPAARLDGRARLGWTSWVSPNAKGKLRADAHLSRHRRRTRLKKGS